ncbi:MAG: hypothetical protein JO057_30505 [Chloroflexi bacterium]|nr:hypothetical protein [Chloroflexota bacterium]
MQLRTFGIFGLSLAAVVLVACSEGPPTQGQAVDFASVCDKANDGHRVAVEGYLRLPDQIEVFKSRSGSVDEEIVVVRLFQSKKFDGTPVGVNFDFGTGPNTMDQIPGEYVFSDSDLKVHRADGEIAGFGDPVKISGTVYFPTSLSDVEFTCALSNPLVEGV